MVGSYCIQSKRAARGARGNTRSNLLDEHTLDELHLHVEVSTGAS